MDSRIEAMHGPTTVRPIVRFRCGRGHRLWMMRITLTACLGLVGAVVLSDANTWAMGYSTLESESVSRDVFGDVSMSFRSLGSSGFPVASNAFGLPPVLAQGPTETETASWIDVIFSGGPIGIAMVLLLMALSLTSVYLVVDQILTLRSSELIPTGLADDVRQALLDGQTQAAADLCREKPSLLAFVLLNGIGELPYGWSSVEKAVEEALAEQSARLYRKAEYLSVIGNIAPMVGLLGTVLGMVLAFQRVAESQGTASASELAEGIYQALITTVGGLIVAIPSLGAFAILRNRLDYLVAEAASITQHVFSPLRKKKTAADKKA